VCWQTNTPPFVASSAIEAAAAAGARPLVEVKYDERWQYPVEVSLFPDTTWFDLGYGLEIRNFRPVP